MDYTTQMNAARQGIITNEMKKVSEYDLAQKRLQITAGEQRQIRKALNRLRSKYLAAGRYSDGIDKVIIQVAKPNTSRHMFW